jgi:two-component system phosphate regulon response regulator PhoB
VTHRILIADDELDMLNLVALNLSGAGYQVLKSEDGPSAVSAAQKESPALIVLDVMMPGMTGLEVCRVLKNDKRTSAIPIVLLTAKRCEVDRILAFELGADDYLTKPFSPRELILRIQAILRRRFVASHPVNSLSAGAIVMNLECHEITVAGEPVELTAIEFKLLNVLLERRGRVQTRETLLNTVWGLEEIETRTVDTHLRRLREKLGPASEQIHTVRGFGYRLDDQ